MFLLSHSSYTLGMSVWPSEFRLSSLLGCVPMRVDKTHCDKLQGMK